MMPPHHGRALSWEAILRGGVSGPRYFSPYGACSVTCHGVFSQWFLATRPRVLDISPLRRPAAPEGPSHLEIAAVAPRIGSLSQVLPPCNWRPSGFPPSMSSAPTARILWRSLVTWTDSATERAAAGIGADPPRISGRVAQGLSADWWG